MNAQHKLRKIQNRLRRIARRIRELTHEKAEEIKSAEELNNEPNLSEIQPWIHRLERRQNELSV